MARNKVTGIRFDQIEEDALKRAAELAVIAPTTLAHKIVVEWLRENGYLPKPE